MAVKQSGNASMAAKWCVIALLVSAIILGAAMLTACALAEPLGGTTNDRVQGVGAILAIVAAGATALYQIERQRAEVNEERRRLVQVAYQLAFDAIEIVSERLDSALTAQHKAKPFALRGDRARELIEAMRELAASSLPPDMLSDFTTLRAIIFAINERLSTIYASEDVLAGVERHELRGKRAARLESCIAARRAADAVFEDLSRTATGYGAVRRSLTRYHQIHGTEAA